MTKLDVSIEGATGDALRAHVRDLSSMLDSKHVNLTEMGKLYASITRTLLEAIEQGGHSSLRFRAAAKALDLKTPKSRLASFLRIEETSMSTHPTDFQGSVIDALREAIERQVPNSQAEVNGGEGHFSIEVISPVFAGKSTLQSQRIVYGAIAHLMKGDGAPVHAVDNLKTRIPAD